MTRSDDRPDATILTLVDDLPATVALAEARFERIAETLRRLLPATALIAHVGATAIPGCQTKGDLDIAVRVPEPAFTEAEAVLARLFPDNPGSVRTASFAAFADEGADPPVGIQLVAIGAELDVFVRFRDRLRSSSTLVDAYNALKRRYDGGDMAAYRSAKTAFIAAVLETTDIESA